MLEDNDVLIKRAVAVVSALGDKLLEISKEMGISPTNPTAASIFSLNLSIVIYAMEGLQKERVSDLGKAALAHCMANSFILGAAVAKQCLPFGELPLSLSLDDVVEKPESAFGLDTPKSNNENSDDVPGHFGSIN